MEIINPGTIISLAFKIPEPKAMAFGGVLTLGLIDNLLNLFNVQTYYQQIVKGFIIVFAVLARRKEQ